MLSVCRKKSILTEKILVKVWKILAFHCGHGYNKGVENAESVAGDMADIDYILQEMGGTLIK